MNNTKNTELNTYQDLNLAFYTYFYGSNNNPAFKIPPLPSLKYKCYYYTNNKDIIKRLQNTNWISIYDNKPTNDDLIESCMVGKHIKSMPHEYIELKDYSYLCFLDSKSPTKVNEKFVENFIIKYFIKQNYILLLREHWVRINSEGKLTLAYHGGRKIDIGNSKPMGVWNEYNASMDQKRYRLESEKYKKYIHNQIKNGLSEITEHHCAGGFLIRNMKHEKMNELNTIWYKHIQECGIQDQISFFFVKQLFDGYIYSFTEYPF